MESNREGLAGGSTGSTGAGSSTGTTGFTGAGSTGSTGFNDDAGTRAGSFDRKFTGEDQGDLKDRVSEKLHDGRDAVSDKLEEGRERLGDAVGTGKTRVASQMERLSERIEERARTMEDAGGVQRRAGQVALRATGALDTGADYIRTHDPDQMRDDLENTIRERPLLSVGLAVGAGFLLARLLRD
ncbi:MAG TPA: hypothetical protein VK928_02165 [Longimicrobiales bacterium]|nr:hypothetical protein [Longimicrobiales bacterium]